MKTLVVSGFPGVGKTTLFKNTKKSVLDSDSSKFDKSNFPENYINDIKNNIGLVDIICVSSHLEVREALVDNDISFLLVYPNLNCKEDYIKRYKNRGSDNSFIDLLDKNWDFWIKQLQSQKGCSHLVLDGKTYLGDIIC